MVWKCWLPAGTARSVSPKPTSVNSKVSQSRSASSWSMTSTRWAGAVAVALVLEVDAVGEQAVGRDEVWRGRSRRGRASGWGRWTARCRNHHRRPDRWEGLVPCRRASPVGRGGGIQGPFLFLSFILLSASSLACFFCLSSSACLSRSACLCLSRSASSSASAAPPQGPPPIACLHQQ